MTDPLELRATDLLTTVFDADLAARGLWLWAGGDGNALVFASDARETLRGIWRMARAGGDGRPACTALLREALFESPGDLAALRLSRELVEEASTDWMDQVAVTALHLGRAPGGAWKDDSQLAIALATLPEMPPTTLVIALAASLDRHLSSEVHAGLLAHSEAWTIAPAEDFDRERLFAPASVIRALAALLHGVEALAGPADAREFVRPEPAEARHRHAVDIAARGQRRGVEIGVGIEPQHAQLAARIPAPPRDRGNRTDRERVVAAQQDRHAPGAEFRRDGIVDQPAPRRDFRQVAVTAARRQHRVERAVEVAHVPDVGDEAGQRLAHAGDTKRVGAHVRAANAGADVGRGTDDADESVFHGAKLTAPSTAWVRTRPFAAQSALESRTGQLATGAIEEQTTRCQINRRRTATNPLSRHSAASASMPQSSSAGVTKTGNPTPNSPIPNPEVSSVVTDMLEMDSPAAVA